MRFSTSVLREIVSNALACFVRFLDTRHQALRKKQGFLDTFIAPALFCYAHGLREDGANPSRTRRCNRGRKPQLIATVTPQAWWEGAASRVNREPEDLPMER